MTLPPIGSATASEKGVESGLWWRAPVAAGLAGFAIMALELTAVRLMAPHFGDSAFVWTNVIGVIMIALALGAFLGGRLADTPHGDRRLSAILIGSAIWTAIVPLVAAPLGDALLPQDLKLDHAMPALVRGSLVATLLLFAPGVALAGCLTPMLVRRVAASHGRVGRASGGIAATSTIGSLAGTFATTHWLVPEVGSRATIWCSAVLLAVVAVLVRRGQSRGGGALLVLLAGALCALGAGAVPSWPLRAVSAGQRVVAEVESRYQFLRVVEQQEGDAQATLLQINEGLDSFHSVRLGEDGLTGGRYYDFFAGVPWLLGSGAPQSAPYRIASLGDAAGTFSRLFSVLYPEATVDAVELDPAVVALGAEHFGGRGVASGSTYADLDARVFVERARDAYDAILVDAYERQIYVPAHVASVEFFSSLRDRLQLGGVVAVNSGGRTFDDPVVSAIGATLAKVFDGAWAFRVPRSRNFMLVARKDGTIHPDTFARLALPATGPLAGPGFARIRRSLAQIGLWRRFGSEDGQILVDDRPFLDSLQDQELRVEVGKAQLVAMHGSRDPAEVERLVADHVAAGAYEDALAELSGASKESPELRELAGDVRWHLHDPTGAEAEYQRVLSARNAARVAPEVRQRLLGKLQILDEDRLQPARRARAIASRNAWLAAAVGALWLMLAAGLWRRSRVTAS